MSNIQFDDGSEQLIPNAILTTKYSHTVSLYQKVCKETNFNPLSPSTLWRILKTLKPSKRKSLAGLDDITADGMNGFGFLDDFLTRLKKEKSIKDRLEKGKRYLKTFYQSHCAIDS